MFRILAVLAFIAALQGGTPASADNCNGGQPTTRCDTVVDQSYQGGGYDPNNLVPITACLSDRLYQSIRLRDGSSAFEAGFYYGRGAPEVVATARNNACWTHGRNGARQHGAVGAQVVAFICCDDYCGWVGGAIPANGRVDLRPFSLSLGHDPMRSYRLSGGGYDSNRILRR